MSDHIDRKRLVRKYMKDANDIHTAAERCALRERDKQILIMVLCKHQDLGFIADTLGYSYGYTKRRFSAALDVFVDVAQKLNFIP